MTAVHVDDHGHWPAVWLGQLRVLKIHRPAVLFPVRIPACQPLWIGPVQRLVDRKEVLDELACLSDGVVPPAPPRVLHQVVEPGDLGPNVLDVLYGVGGVVELGVTCGGEARGAARKVGGVGPRIRQRAVAPDRRRVEYLVGGKQLVKDAPYEAVPVVAGQDLLLDLAQRDLVLRATFTVLPPLAFRPPHNWRDHQRRHVLWDALCIQSWLLGPAAVVPPLGAVATPAAAARRTCFTFRFTPRPLAGLLQEAARFFLF
mmetsp:Transcript_49185/g.152712  ORF Transcript_49185/g.152712 Transcript_49185/m.152712 type:complete len:258 (-) Transcript_49185:203-976(-)